jgi:hypothetical protein
MLGTAGDFSYGLPVLFFLRCIGITNAAIWFGAAFFSCAVLGPSFASSHMLSILHDAHAGRAAQIVLERFFILQYWCGGIALTHLFVEWLYTARPLKLWTVYLVIGLLGLGLVGGSWLHPKVTKLHLDLHGPRSTPQQRENARQPLRVWQDVSQVMQYLAAFGLLIHLIQAAAPTGPPRFSSANKFKG